MAAATVLSDLPDDLLRRILSFARAKEGASTAVLSRRWRWLWRTSGAINLDSRSYTHLRRPEDTRTKSHLFARHLEAALASAFPSVSGVGGGGGWPVRKLTLYVEDPCYSMNLIYNLDGSRRDLLATLLSTTTPAAAVEELRFTIAGDPRYGGELPWPNLSELRFESLPSESLTTLHVTNCNALIPPPPPAGAAMFRRLADLRLRWCGASLADLRRIVSAAPQLAILHLEPCYYYSSARNNLNVGGGEAMADGPASHRVVCPAMTTLVVTACSTWPWKEEGELELEVPRLQYFRYKGLVHHDNNHQLSLKVLLPASANLRRTDLHFVRADCQSGLPIRVDRLLFWEFVQSLNVTKVMKLKLDFDTSHVAVAEKDDAFFSNNMFCNLERLELEVPSEAATATGSKTPALLIANLLHCCPVVRDLHVKVMTKRLKTSARQIKHRSDFNKAINHFRNHRKSPEIFLNGENDGGNENYKVSDIPGLSDRTFNCLKSNLRAVGLQFWMDEPNCFGPQLAKFFVENAAVLEEISIDDGNHKMHEHMNHMIKRWWIHSSSKRKNSPITTAFRDCDARKRQTREADNS